MDLDTRHYLYKAKELQDSEALQSAYRLIMRTTGRVDPELVVVCAEAALQMSFLEESAACLKMFFEGNPPANQFLSRAYLCQAQLKTPQATGTVDDFKEAILSFLKAIEVAKSVLGCSFIVFNASVLYFHSVRPLLQPGRRHHLVQSLRQVVRSLEEVADQDHSWRAELMMHLIICIVDSGNMEDAASFANMTEEFINSHSPHLYPQLFTLQVGHKLKKSEVLIEKSRHCSTLTVIYKIQDFKKLVSIMESKQTEKELEHIFNLLEYTEAHKDSRPPQSPTPIQPADRVAFLLELAVLALQLKHLKVAADCLKELKSAGEPSNGQRMIIECVKCEINVLKREAKMNDYSNASVEAWLKDIGKLDQCLQTAVREKDPQAIQAVCATQWSLCLPLLQHNLRKRIKAPLLRVSQVLEHIQSMLEMRCQVHLELAMIEEEEGRLDAALTHLQKASQLDNGTQRERLSSALHLLKLRGTQNKTSTQPEDKAAMLMQQIKDMQPQDKTGIRPVLVAVGLLLAPWDFQTVLDADNILKSYPGSGPAALLCAKAQHHSVCVQKADGYLASQNDDTDVTERVKLWATLVKMAREQGVWDVCRAACRFCLLYDDGRWKISNNDDTMMNHSQADEYRCTEEKRGADCPHSSAEGHTCVKDLLRLLAETHFISAEANIHKLMTEGVQLNGTVVPAVDVCVSEEDPQWVVYREWIKALSAYATSSFLRAAELGVQLKEPWVLANAAVYLWNYSSHLPAAGEYQRLLPAFQSLLEMFQETKYTGSQALFVLLCNAAARGLIQPLCGPENIESTPPTDKNSKHRAEKGKEKAVSAQGVNLDHAAMQEVHKALEVCDYSLRLATRKIPGEPVPIAVRKQLVTTWVQIKRLLQEQIGSKINSNYCESEEVSLMMHVLVGIEMLQCNRNPRHMEFSVPSLSTLVSLASECIWADAVVELQVWCQLAAFCHDADEHSLVLLCTERALQREEAAEKSLNTQPCVLYGLTAVNEMLSGAVCLKGLSLFHASKGNVNTCREALTVFMSAISFAEKADSPALYVAAARHYWNTCLQLTQCPEERWCFQEPLEKIVAYLVQISNKKKEGRAKEQLTFTAQRSQHEAAGEEELILRAVIYTLLLRIHTEKADWKSAKKLLDQAVRNMPSKRYQLPLLKQLILVKARLGESVLLDMEKLQDEGEQCCSSMWHQMALCVGTITQQHSCYQKAITSLLSDETWWKKVSLLLEFGEWLYCQNFPKADAQSHVKCAIDILLQRDAKQGAGEHEDDFKQSSVKCESPVGLQGSLSTNSLSDLKEVRLLDSLMQAHTLLAVIDKASTDHQPNLLKAYTLVLEIWQVSMKVCCEVSSEGAKTHAFQASPSAGSKKGKDKGKGKKGKDLPPGEEKAKTVVLDQELPSTTIDWARFTCPEPVRQIFRTNRNPYCINAHSITKQNQTLFYLNLLAKELHSLSLDHLTLPIMHLAETIAHDLFDRKSLSDLHRLRIVQTCSQLGFEAQSAYHPQLLSLSRIPEQEQMDCRRQIGFPQEGRGLHRDDNQVIWLDKADVCLSMGLFQQARELMAEAQLMSMEIRDQRAVARSLLSLSTLACEEQDFSQALLLLDKAKDLGGDEEFWYQFTLNKITAVVNQEEEADLTKVDQIIKEACAVLKSVQEQKTNRVQELTFFITSLQMRGAVECIRAYGGAETWKARQLCNRSVQRLQAACDTLRECASVFIQLNYNQHAAEAYLESAHALRILSNSTSSTEERHSFLLDGLSLMQLAVTEQEQVVLNAQRLIQAQEEGSGLSLATARRLQRLRLDLAEFSLALLEEQFTEEKHRALAREKKSSIEIALEEFTRCTPEPDSIEQLWSSSNVRQVAHDHLAADQFHSPDNMESRARCLTLKGKYLRLLAGQEDPLYLCALWDRHKQTGAQPDLRAAYVEEMEGNSEEGRDSEPSRGEVRMTPASAELQQTRGRAKQLLAQASETLTEAITLCLQHKLPISILAIASLNMLECHGQSNPALAGQYLALFQSCCTAATMADVLSAACSGTSESQASAFLSVHTKLLLSQEERPTSMLKGLEDSLSSLSKTISHLSINPSHLKILTELPSNLRILLLQHSDDGSELFGAFYEITETLNQKRKATPGAGTLTCSRVAKVSVCPQALLALREQTQAFGQETRLAFFKEACCNSLQTDEDGPRVSEAHQGSPSKTSADVMLALQFNDIVRDMDEYFKPLFTQLDFSWFRSQDASLPVPQTQTKDKEEKESAEKSVADPGQCLVLLAEKKLLELPLEALSILQEDGLTSVSRDFSLQLLHSRLKTEEPQKVESDNKKKTKGGKGAKAKVDQSSAIKVGPVTRALPSNTLLMDTSNFKYIVDTNNEGSFDGTSLSSRIEKILESYSKHLTNPWEGIMGNKQTPSLSEIEELLSRCSAFIYLGMERFMANVPPGKLAALNLSDCCIALLFDLVQSKASNDRQTNLDNRKSSRQLALEKPVETALLLSLGGVSCIALNQWHSGIKQNLQHVEHVLDNLLRVRLTSGQTVHALRREESSKMTHHEHTGPHDQLTFPDSEDDDVPHKPPLKPSAFNFILYGLPNLITM